MLFEPGCLGRSPGMTARSTVGSRRLPSRDALLRVALAAAHAGGRRTLEWFGRRISPEIKADGSPVTPADRASEREIRETIRRTYPTHSILGEELGPTPGDARIRWVIDPIDGTKSFVHGVPLYSVLVAVEVDGQSVVGVVHLPALGDTVEATLGGGCRWNGRKARVSSIGRLSDATVLTTSVRALEASGASFRRIASATRTQRGWGDAYGHVLVATGRADAMIDTGLQAWDVAPLRPILREAGGSLTNWVGEPGDVPGNYVSSNGLLHKSLLKIVGETNDLRHQ